MLLVDGTASEISNHAPLFIFESQMVTRWRDEPAFGDHFCLLHVERDFYLNPLDRIGFVGTRIRYILLYWSGRGHCQANDRRRGVISRRRRDAKNRI